MVTARDPTVLRESGGASPSWTSHASSGHASSDGSGQSDKPCYWVNIWMRLNAMRNCFQLCDINLEADDGTTFRAHSAVLAASSDLFHAHMTRKKSSALTETGKNKFLIPGVSGPALKVTLDFVYGIAPTDPDQLSLLLEGGQVMGISGALAFCERNNIARQNNSLCTAASTMSPDAGNKSTKHYSKPAQPLSDLTLIQINDANARGMQPGHAPDGNAFINPHSEFVLDLSFNDLETMGKCPVLKDLTNESSENTAPAVLSGEQCPFGEGRQTLQKSCEGRSDTDLADNQRLDHSQSDQAMDAGNDDQKAQQLNDAVDLDIGELTCPFAKSYNGKHTAGEANAIAQGVKDGSISNGDAILHCPFLKSLEDMPTDAMMKVTEEDQSQEKVSTQSSGKMIESLNLLPNNEDGGQQQHNKLSSFQTNVSVSSEMLPTTSWQNIPEQSMNGQTSSPVDSGQFGMNGFMETSTPELTDQKTAHLYSAGQAESLSNACPMIASSGISQVPVCDPIPAVGTQSQLLSTQNGLTDPVNLSNGMMEQNPMVPVANGQLGRQFEESSHTAHLEFTSMASDGIHQLNATASQRQNMYDPGYSVDCQKPDNNISSSHNASRNPFLPEMGPGKDMQFYPSAASSLPSCRSASSLIDLIYCSGSGDNDLADRQSSSCMLMSTAGSSVAVNSVSSEARPLPGILPSQGQQQQQHHASVIRSPDGGRCRSSVVSPDGQPGGGSMASPPNSLVWDAASAQPPMDNATIKAKLKLNRGQEYICLVENCGYSNKCLDYMQSHMYRKHGLGQPDVLCPLCQKAFFSLGQLKGHTKRAHKPDSKPSDAEAVQCEDCSEMFPNVQKLQTHRLKSHCKGRLFTCEECDFRSPRKKDVQAHMVSQHKKIPPGVQVFECMHCDYKCTDKNRAEEHQAMHTGQPKFVCRICGKSYTTRRGMRTHMQYHSTERPHRCDTCNAAFKVRSKLRDHIRLVHTHVGVKPYECGYCGHKTALRGNCNQHCRKHHPDMPVCVIDHQQGERRNKRSYDYAGLKGEGIEECRDVRKHLRAVSP